MLSADVVGVLVLAALTLAPVAGRVDDGHAAWSARGAYVAFDRMRQLAAGYSNTSIYVVRADGRRLRRITQRSEPADAVEPVWSPGGRWIAFVVASKYLPPRVWWTRRDGRAALTPVAGGDTSNLAISPSWSPDSRRLAFGGRFAGRSGLYVADRNTGRTRLLAAGDVRSAAWSPDGRRIAFSDSASIALVPAAGGPVTRLPAPPGLVAGGEPAVLRVGVLGRRGVRQRDRTAASAAALSARDRDEPSLLVPGRAVARLQQLSAPRVQRAGHLGGNANGQSRLRRARSRPGLVAEGRPDRLHAPDARLQAGADPPRPPGRNARPAPARRVVPARAARHAMDRRDLRDALHGRAARRCAATCAARQHAEVVAGRNRDRVPPPAQRPAP